MGKWLPLTVLTLAGFLAPARSLHAQDGLPSVELPEPALLRQGERAPFTGQLMTHEDLLRWARTIEELQHRLALDVRTEVQRCDVRLELERARTQASDDRLALREGLLRDRIRELVEEVERNRRVAVREWYESPALWFAIGAVVTAGATVALASAMGN